MAKPKSKLAYLSYDQIQPKIDGGLLDEYDLIFEKFEHVLYIIDKNKNIVPITSRIDFYQSESSAIAALNNKTDTYNGQIINILENDSYIPYSVNLDSSTGSYYITRIGIIDYNELHNKPIINIIADNEVILSELDDCIYSLVGNYRISDLDTTHRMTTTKEFFIKETSIEDNVEYIYITKISGKNIQKFICTNDSFIEDRYVLFSELGKEVDDIIQVEVPTIVDDMIQEEVPGIINDYVQTNQATDDDINNLFH